MSFPAQGLSQLRKNRIRIPGARYFITCVTQDRKTGLTTDTIWAELLRRCATSGADFLAIVCMPDHVHALFVLPAETNPGEIVRSVKGPLTPVLRRAQLSWQKNFFEHRLRANEDTEPYLRYMLCNPYRAQLIANHARWPYWKILSESAQWFIEKFPTQRPEAEWLLQTAPWQPEEPKHQP